MTPEEILTHVQGVLYSLSAEILSAPCNDQTFAFWLSMRINRIRKELQFAKTLEDFKYYLFADALAKRSGEICVTTTIKWHRK